MPDISPASSSNRRRIIAGISLILGPALVILADILTNRRLTYLTLMWGATVFLLLGALSVAHLLRARADWLGLIGAGCCLTGLMAYSGAMSIYRFGTVFQRGVEGVPADAIELAFKFDPRLFTLTFLPPHLWPLGLLILGIGLIRDRRLGVATGYILGLGAILFYLGRGGGMLVAVIPGDLLIFAALAWIGIRLLRQPRLWEDSTTG